MRKIVFASVLSIGIFLTPVYADKLTDSDASKSQLPTELWKLNVSCDLKSDQTSVSTDPDNVESTGTKETVCYS